MIHTKLSCCYASIRLFTHRDRAGTSFLICALNLKSISRKSYCSFNPMKTFTKALLQSSIHFFSIARGQISKERDAITKLIGSCLPSFPGVFVQVSPSHLLTDPSRESFPIFHLSSLHSCPQTASQFSCRSVAYSKDLWSMCNLYTNPTALCGGSYLFSGIDNHHLLKSFFLNTLLLETHQSNPNLILPRTMAWNPVILLCGVRVFLTPSGYFWSPGYTSKICRQLV